MSSWDSHIEGGVVGLRILEAETTASVQSLLQFPTTGVVGQLLLETNTTASAQMQLGGGVAGRKIFEAATTASVQQNSGGGVVGRVVFESSTTASAQTQLDVEPRQLRVVVKTSAYQVTAGDNIILLNNSAAVTVDLPSAVITGKQFYFKKISSATAAATVSAASNIDGAATVALNGSLRPFRTIVGGNGTWNIIGASNEI